MQRYLLWMEVALIAVAVAGVGFAAYAWIDAWMYQRSGMQELQRLSTAPPEGGPPPSDGALLGQIVIPQLGVSSVILEGTAMSTLQRAVGHVSGTALPGKPGNICLAGHRDSFFRQLRNVVAGHEIVIHTPGGSATYRVEGTGIVSPAQVAVLKPTRDDALTLITCYPFGYLGSAPKRFVVRARAVPKAMEASTAGFR